jgi:hypothetical protein
MPSGRGMAKLQKLNPATRWDPAYYLDVRADTFVHFTTRSRAEAVVASGKLMMNPPYSKFGGDAVYAISTTFGEVVKGTQTSHTPVTKDDPLVAVVFKTSTIPDYAFVEEVVWHEDVRLHGAKIVPATKGFQMVKSSPEKLGEDEVVTYKPNALVASKVARRYLLGV